MRHSPKNVTQGKNTGGSGPQPALTNQGNFTFHQALSKSIAFDDPFASGRVMIETAGWVSELD